MYRYISFVILLVFISHQVAKSQLIINEIQSSNTTTIVDEFNEYPDWLEIRNVGVNPVNLVNWYLSDDKLLLRKWQFPDFNIAADGHILVYASDRNLRQIPVNWYTVIDKDSVWKYLVPVTNISDEWRTSTTFDDSGWNAGSAGFGYADGDDVTQVSENTITIYIRKVFNLENSNNITRIFLHMDYDDGFVAYLNGVEVARVNMGASGSYVGFDMLAEASHEAMIYQGGQPDAFDISNYLSALHTGNNVFAVEIHNNGVTSTDLSGIPFLTLGKQSALEPGQTISTFISMGNSAPHTNFKINTGNETIYLSNNSGLITDSISPVIIPSDVSYGRLYNNINSKRFFSEPTPGSPNNSQGLTQLSEDTISFSIPGGYHSPGFSLELSAETDSVFYTIDGSDPNLTSSIYTSSIYIDTSIVVKARVIKMGLLPGRIYANTYITDHSSTLPIFCLSTNPENLWDFYTGIYVMGPNAQPDNPNFGANFWQDWEKPFQIEYYDRSNILVINQLGGSKIFGNWSRACPQKSFALFARSTYGDSDFDYPFFAKKSRLENYKSIVLRNNANDWDRAFMRDAFITDITSHLGVEYQASQSVAAYLNGQYWGVYDLREKVNEDFLEANCHADADDINLLEQDGVVVEGINSEYAQLKNFLTANASLASAENFNYVSDRIDVDNFIKYQLIQTYVNNTDWPGNNIKFWKSNQPLSKWRWILYDTEFSLGIYDEENYRDNPYRFALEVNNGSWPNPQWSTLLFRRLVTNTGFRNDFINQAADNINTTFLPENINYHVDSIRNQMMDEMVYHNARWNRSYNNWLYEVERIKTWCSQRPPYALGYLQQTFELPGRHTVTLTISSQQEGFIRINTITPAVYPFSGVYFEEVPIEIEASPKPGYRFVRWEGAVSGTDRMLTHSLTNDVTFKAVFEEATSEDVQLVINEINYNSSDQINSGDWIEIYNNGNTSIDLSGFLFSDSNPDSGFYFPANTILYTNKYLVVCKDLDKFSEIYPQVKNVISGFEFGLSSGGDELRIYDLNQNVMDAVDYLPYSPWPVEANGYGSTLELIDPDLDNGQPESWKAIKTGGTPGERNTLISSVKQVEITSYENILRAFPVHFSDYITIDAVIQEQSPVKLEIVDLHGNVIKDLSPDYILNNNLNADWIPDPQIASGIYIIRLLTSDNQYHITVVYTKN